ncbi:MAG: hypothetical protein IPL22_14830 [Bacteroidetes bacterium]|nr:hypothetical protein [Bacteroidota bacterium]
MKSIFTLLLLIATASSCTMDQSHLTAKSSDINFEGCPVWTIEGLGSNSILKNNFSFKKEYKADSTLQIGNYIRAMIQDKSGNIWVGTHGKGLARFDGKMLKFFNEDDNFNSIVVRILKKTRKVGCGLPLIKESTVMMENRLLIMILPPVWMTMKYGRF